MNRLLMAAARGARVQYRQPTWKEGVWFDAALHDALADASWYKAEVRIHPKDAHLEYGPVSTALRDISLQGVVMEIKTEWEYVARYYFTDIAWEKAPRDVEHRSLFLLILAEALCDEGL